MRPIQIFPSPPINDALYLPLPQSHSVINTAMYKSEPRMSPYIDNGLIMLKKVLRQQTNI